jgi:hypothetical protein
VRVVGLVTTTRPEKLQMMIDSLSDCDDVIVFEDKERRGVGWARNQLIDLAPPNSIVRFVDDDDIAFSTRQMAERLVEKDLDALTCSYIVQDQRITVPDNAITACCNRVSSWSWVANIDTVRSLRWDESKKVMTGAWQWLKYVKNNLKLGTAPDIWCYHWIPAEDGITAQHADVPEFELYQELLSLVEERGTREDLLHLADRFSHYEAKYSTQHPISSRYKALFNTSNVVEPTLHHKLKLYTNTRGQLMIATRKNTLTPDQCADIVAVATQNGFQKAAIRNTDGTSRYNETHRDSTVAFIRAEQLQPVTWSAIHETLNSINSEHYKADIDQFDLQVAEYSEGQTGFDWHSDDPPYPSNNLLWSGRKLTYVFELSDSSTYEGGYLDVDPYRTPVPSKAAVQHFNIDYEKIAAVIANLDPNEIAGKTHVSINIDDAEISPSVVSSAAAVLATAAQLPKREQGECVAFPSFFYHKANGVTRGKRYSLTVWAKGPVWV